MYLMCLLPDRFGEDACEMLLWRAALIDMLFVSTAAFLNQF
ncbi:MAG: hypothetical protein R6X10_16025 [Desulfobacterales bacterium]